MNGHKYRKRPVVIRAFQWSKDMGNIGGVQVDSIIQGETYPCKPDIFDACYEKVESHTMTNREALEELKRRLEKRGVIDFDIMILEWLDVLEDMGVKVHKNIVPWIERLIERWRREKDNEERRYRFWP